MVTSLEWHISKELHELTLEQENALRYWILERHLVFRVGVSPWGFEGVSALRLVEWPRRPLCRRSPTSR